MAKDQTTTLGLNTDLPPDGLGDQAFHLRNVLPASGRNVKPRPGVSLVKHYKPNSVGRAILVDGLPADLGQGIMILAVNTEDAGAGDGTLKHTVEGVFAFRPMRIAEEYYATAGFDLALAIGGVAI